MKKAVCYARFSSKNQRCESIDAQIREVEQYVKYNNLLLLDYYVDERKTGTNSERPAFKKMLDDSKSKKFDYVIVHKLDRFSRNRYDSVIAKHILKQNGVKVISATEKIGDSAESIFLETLIEGANEYYSINLSSEIKKGLKENALKCMHNGGNPPFGYDVDKNKKYVINELEAKAVKKVFEMYINGFTYVDIVRWLDINNYKTKLGAKFKESTIPVILKNIKYTGLYTFGKKEKNSYIEIEDGMPKIIEKNIFEIVKKKLKKEK